MFPSVGTCHLENLATFVFKQMSTNFLLFSVEEQGKRKGGGGQGGAKSEAARQQSHKTHLEVITEPVMLSDSYRLKHCIHCLKWI